MHVPAKLGPLPTWAWGLVLLGGLGLGLYLRRHSSSSPTASLVSAGGPVGVLGTGGGGSAGDGTSGVATGMDPVLAQMLADGQSALVNESAIFSGLAAQSMQGALDAATSGLALASTVATSTSPVIYTVGSSPAGSSPAGTTTPTIPPPEPFTPPPPPPAPPALTPAQAVGHAEFLAHQAALRAPGAGTHTAGF